MGSYLKLKTLPLFFFLFGSLSAQEVDYVPFSTDTAKWSQTVELRGIEPGMLHTERGWDYYLLGDTIVNGMTYSKVYHLGLFKRVEENSFFVDTELILVGGIREDTSQKIYFFCFAEVVPTHTWDYGLLYFEAGEEYLLYDFDLELGDSLDWVIYPPDSKVIAIDTVELYEDHFRKRYIIQNADLSGQIQISWISGIRSSLGLFGPYNIFDEHVWRSTKSILGKRIFHYKIFL